MSFVFRFCVHRSLPRLRRRFRPQILIIGIALLLAVLAGVRFGGWSASKTAAALQQGCAPDCAATVPATGEGNAPIPFSATATTTGCATTPTFEWDFGDGTARATQQNTIHNYTSAGTYNWRLTVTAATGTTSIDTIAGGLGEGAPARQATLQAPAVVARDPQGRGIYYADSPGSDGLIRFINTSAATVTIAGHSIAAGTVRAIAGGGSAFDTVEDTPGLGTLLSDIKGLATSPNGDLLYFADLEGARIRALNVSATTQTVAGQSVGAGRVRTLISGAPPVPSSEFSLSGLAVHPTTGEVYGADSSAVGNRVLKITAAGAATVVAGNSANTRPSDAFTPGPATGIPLLTPRAIEFDPAGNYYLADAGHGRVIRVDANGAASLVVQFTADRDRPISPYPLPPYPSGLAFFNGRLYIANGNAQNIVRMDGATASIISGTINTACNYSSSSCGDGGPLANATYNLSGSTSTPPFASIAADANGLYVCDQAVVQRGRIRYLNLSNAAVALAGTSVAAGTVNTIAGSGLLEPYDSGLAISGLLGTPVGLAADQNDNLFIAEVTGQRLRFVNRGANAVTIFANTPAAQTVAPGAIVTVNKDSGQGQIDGVPVSQTQFESPQGLAFTGQGLLVADTKRGPTTGGARTGLIRFINTSASNVTFYPGSSTPIIIPPGNIAAIAGGGQEPNNIGNGRFALEAKFLGPSDVAVSPVSGDIYVADVVNRAVRRINSNTGVVSSLSLAAARYTGLGFDASARLYVTDFENNQLLRETAPGGGAFARLDISGSLNRPRDVAVDAAGNAYVTNSGNHRIAQVNASGQVTTLAGTTQGFDGDGGAAASAQINIAPTDVFIGVLGTQMAAQATVGVITAGSEVLFTDSNNGRVRRIGTGAAMCVKSGTITISGGTNPTPALSALTPTSSVAGGRAFTLGVTGTGFIPTSKVRWNGEERPTSFVSNTQLTAQIATGDVLNPGTANVTVVNPAPGGGTSNQLPFQVRTPNPVPSLNEVVPNRAVVGAAFTLIVNGTNFINGSQVQWEGRTRPTTFVNDTLLRAEIPATDLASPGFADITVLTPEPGGGVSNASRFTIVATNPVPALNSLSHNAAPRGGQAFTLTIEGTNFMITSRARWNGQDRPTTFVSATQLTVQIPATDLANTGTANITVFTPTPGGGVSNTLPLIVGNPVATLSAASFGQLVAAESIAATFGAGLATEVRVADGLPLPTTLAGTTVKVRDASGTERLASLFFVAPGQINFQIPPGTARGAVLITVTAGNGTVSVGNMQIQGVAPGLFSANSNGQGIAAAVALRVAANGAQTFESISRFDSGSNSFVPIPIDLGPSGEQVFLIAFGTGLRGRSELSNVTATLGGEAFRAGFAGPQGGFVGLDQVNLGPIPRALAGRGVVNLALTADGSTANTVTVTIR